MKVFWIVLFAVITAHAADRPQISLDGKWDFGFAPDDRGVQKVTFDREIDVPGCWDTQGVGNPTDKMWHNAIGVGWYRRRFKVPDDWREKRVWLVVGGVHRSAKVFLDDKLVAEHVGYPVAFRADLTDTLRDGEQTLVIAVDSRKGKDDPLYGTFDVADFMELTWGGIFEHVRLEARGETYIDDCFVKPDPKIKRADVELSLGGKIEDVIASYTVTQNGEELAEGKMLVRSGRMNKTIELPAAKAWTPNSPELLTLEVSLLRERKEIDRREVRFGLRRLEAVDGKCVLNGEPIFLRGYGDDFTFPRELLPPADVTCWKAYLQKRKVFGFNFVRHHSMMPTESYLRAADEVGMLVQPELPIAYMEFAAKATPKGRELYAKVWEQYIRQMRNHPSVMAWCMGNEELNGLPFGAALYAKAKELDPTRMVIDSDGVWPPADRATLDYRSVAFAEWQMPWGANRGKYVNSQVNKPVIVHEMANVSCLPDPAEAGKLDGAVKPFWLEAMNEQVKKRHLEAKLPRMLQASWKLQANLLKLNTEAARLGPGISGYEQWLFRDYWTQSTGIESIVGTNRAITPEFFRQFNSDLVVLWRHDRVNFLAGEKIYLGFWISDFRSGEARTLHELKAWLGDAEINSLIMNRPGTGWGGEYTLPMVATPRKLLLKINFNECRNEWPVWVWPRAPEPAKDLIVTQKLTAEIQAKLEAGARVLVTDERDLFPTQIASFKPAWWKGEENKDFVYGNLFEDHPAVRGFPNDGYGDLQAFNLMDHRAVVKLDEVPGDVEPIVAAMDVPWKLRKMAYLWEARVGKGKMLVSSFDLSEAKRKEDPAVEWMYSLLTNYVAGEKFEPRAEVAVGWIKERLAKAKR